MRDLEKQIATWRRTMSSASAHRPELLDELEAHLRDEIDRLLAAGIPAGEVFQIATSKLGAPASVAAEFDKLTGRAWLPVKIARLLVAVIAALVGAAFLFKLEKAGILLVTHAFTVTLGYSALFIIGGLAICAVGAEWFGGIGPSQRYSLVRSALQFANFSVVFTGLGIVLGAFWARDHLGRYWAWDLKEIGGTLVISWAVLISALGWLRWTHHTVITAAGLLGNAITAWAWFGTNTGSATPGPLLTAFIVSQLLLVVSIPAHRRLKRQT
jgi:hypothetical protein